MSSGCIITECPLCDEIIWEDDENISYIGDMIIHRKCKVEYKEKLNKLRLIEAIWKEK